MDDVAYIFKNLENYAVENSFIVFVKDGIPTIVHVGMGAISATIADLSSVKAAYAKFGADSIYMVHNHPSGNLVCSQADKTLLSELSNMFPKGIVKEGIIINTVSGKYGVFDANTSIGTRDIPNNDNVKPFETYTFNKSVFSKDYNPKSQIRDQRDVAKVVSSHRFGLRNKVSYLILNNKNIVVGNIHSTHTEVNDANAEKIAKEIAIAVSNMGGNAAIIYGRIPDAGQDTLRKVDDKLTKFSGRTAQLFDIVAIDSLPKVDNKVEDNGVEYKSLRSNSNVQIDAYTNEEQEIVDKTKADGTYLKAPNGKDTKLTPKQWVQVRTQAFKDWFGDWENNPESASKVVDENGEPMVVYHGSTAMFNEFETKFIGSSTGTSDGRGFYFTTDKSYANSYQNENGQVLSVFLNIRKPLSYNNRTITKAKFRQIIKAIDKAEFAKDNEHYFLSNYGNYYDNGIDYAINEAVNSEWEYNDSDIELFNSLVSSSGDFNLIAKAFNDVTGMGNSIAPKNNGTTHYVMTIPSDIKSATDNFGTFDPGNNDIRFRSSTDLTEEYGNKWIEEQTNNDGRHTTQVVNTIKSYEKFADFVKKDSNGKKVSVLDASSGLGVGTQHMKSMGINVDDVEPYASANREKPTYDSYNKIDKKYDYIISNAVLNVIPDDWRSALLHDMADVLKVGGKLIINVRGAKSIEQQGVEGKTRITLDNPSEILVTRPDGSIRAYQKGFTKKELKDWVESELGESYSVEIANNNNAGSSYDTAVVVTKNNLSDTYYRTSIDNINEIFNQELQQQIDGTLKEGHIYKLGMPNGILLSTGFPNIPIEMGSTMLKEHAESSKHPFKLEEIKDLVRAIQSPMAIFKYGDKSKAQNLILEIQQGDKNYLIGVHFNKEHNNLVISDIRGVFPKDNAEWLNWISQDKLLRVDKGKIQNLINKQRKTLAEVEYLDLDLITKIIENFVNPTVGEGKMMEEINSISDNLHTPVRIVRDVNEITDGKEHIQRQKRQSKGWFNPETGEVVIVLPNATSVEDVRETMLHEIIAHKGLRDLLGNEFEPMMERIFDDILTTDQAVLIKQYGNKVVAAEEYLATLAERDVNPTIWQKILSIVRDAFRKIGVNLTMNNADLTYLLWRSKNRLQSGATIKERMDFARKDREVRFRSEHSPLDVNDMKLVKSNTSAPAPNLNTNDMKLSKSDRFTQNVIDRMISVKRLQDEIIKRGGKVDINANPYIQENLAASRSMGENNKFQKTIYRPLVEQVSKLEKMLEELGIATKSNSYERVKDFLYARHAPERNKKICIDEMRDYAISKLSKEDKEKLGDKMVDIINAIAGAIYDNNLAGSTSIIDYSKVLSGYTAIEIASMKSAISSISKSSKSKIGKIHASAIINKVIDEIIIDLNDNAREELGPRANDIVRDIVGKVYTNNTSGSLTPLNYSSILKNYNITLTSSITTVMKQIEQDAIDKLSSPYPFADIVTRSGITDNEAKEIIDRLYNDSNNEIRAEFDKLSDYVKQASDFTLDTWFKYNLISSEQLKEYKDMYQYYIPLRSWAEKEEVDYDQLGNDAFRRTSEIVNLNRRASGRTSKADDPIAFIGSLAQSAIVVGNKNEIRVQAFRMISQNQELISDLATIPTVYEVEEDDGTITETFKRPQQALFDAGKVRKRSDKSYHWHKTPAQIEAHTVPVIINGTRHYIEFKGNMGVLVASAINNTNTVNWDVLNGVRNVSRWVAANMTSKNLEFGFTNFTRDFMFGNLAYFLEGGDIVKLNKNIGSAFRTIHNDFTGNGAGADQALYEQFKEDGGQTGFVHLQNIDRMKKDIDILRRKASGNKTLGDKLFRNIVMQFGSDALEYMNTMAENAMRFAVYKTEIEKGTDRKTAAYKAKEITVNFNRKGTHTGNYNALYNFFNASVQGTARLYQLAKENPVRFTAAVASLAMVQFTAGMMSALVSGDDDEGKNAYDKLSDYTKFSNIVIPSPFGKDQFITIPIAQGVRGLTNIAPIALDMIRGKKTAEEAGGVFLSNLIGELSPLDFEAIDFTSNRQGKFVALAPTLLKPFFEVTSNRDFRGLPIYKEDFLQSQEGYTPEYKKVYKRTAPVLVKASKYLNRLGGGTDELSSSITFDKETGEVGRSWHGHLFDKNPAALEHILSGFIGGRFNFVNNIYKTASSAILGEEIETTTLPILNRFVKESYGKPGYETFYELKDRVNDINATEKGFNALQDWDSLGSFMRNIDNTFLPELFKAYNSTLKDITNKMYQLPINSQERKDLEGYRDQLILECAKQYNDYINSQDNEAD